MFSKWIKIGKWDRYSWLEGYLTFLLDWVDFWIGLRLGLTTLDQFFKIHKLHSSTSQLFCSIWESIWVVQVIIIYCVFLFFELSFLWILLFYLLLIFWVLQKLFPVGHALFDGLSKPVAIILCFIWILGCFYMFLSFLLLELLNLTSTHRIFVFRLHNLLNFYRVNFLVLLLLIIWIISRIFWLWPLLWWFSSLFHTLVTNH